jgi:hypothetical protein
MDERKDFPVKYREAEREARRFLEFMAVLKVRFNNDDYFRQYMGIKGGPETAAVKRASMDLSRALARMRRPS